MAQGRVGARAEGRSDLDFDGVYRRYYALAANVARRSLIDKAWADDVAQQVLFDLWRRELPRASLGNLGGWIRTAARYQAISINRRRRLPTVAGVDLDHLADKCASTGYNALLECLPPEQRRALVLRCCGGFTITQIAEVTEAPIGTVQTRLYRARKALLARKVAK